MSVQLFNLRGVPEDEAQEIRELLTANGIGYYETPAGSWGMSIPALWLKDATQLEQARRMLEQYQGERYARARNAYEQSKKAGESRTLFDVVKENPLRVIVYLAVVLVVIYFSTKPFMAIGQ